MERGENFDRGGHQEHEVCHAVEPGAQLCGGACFSGDKAIQHIADSAENIKPGKRGGESGEIQQENAGYDPG